MCKLQKQQLAHFIIVKRRGKLQRRQQKGERTMVREKKKNPQGAAIAQMIVDQYQPGSPEEVQEAMKDILWTDLRGDAPGGDGSASGVCQ